MRPRFADQWPLDHTSGGIREVIERYNDETGRLELDQGRFAFGYTVAPEEADLVGRSAQGLINSFALLKGAFQIQQSQLIRTLDAVYQDGYYRGSTYAYQMGRRDAAFAIGQGLQPIHGTVHHGESMAESLRRASARVELLTAEKAAYAEGVDSLQRLNTSLNIRVTSAEDEQKRLEAQVRTDQETLDKTRDHESELQARVGQLRERLQILERELAGSREQDSRLEDCLNTVSEEPLAQLSMLTDMEALVAERDALQEQLRSVPRASSFNFARAMACLRSYETLVSTVIPEELSAAARGILAPVLLGIEEQMKKEQTSAASVKQESSK